MSVNGETRLAAASGRHTRRRHPAEAGYRLPACPLLARARNVLGATRRTVTTVITCLKVASRQTDPAGLLVANSTASRNHAAQHAAGRAAGHGSDRAEVRACDAAHQRADRLAGAVLLASLLTARLAARYLGSLVRLVGRDRLEELVGDVAVGSAEGQGAAAGRALHAPATVGEAPNAAEQVGTHAEPGISSGCGTEAAGIADDHRGFYRRGFYRRRLYRRRVRFCLDRAAVKAGALAGEQPGSRALADAQLTIRAEPALRAVGHGAVGGLGAGLADERLLALVVRRREILAGAVHAESRVDRLLGA